jgi:RimJ/RimL family protein N-acetyltransferase
MPECTIRAFESRDSEWLREWYEADQTGMAAVMGKPLPTADDCVKAFQVIFQGVQAQQSQFWIVECDQEPLGFFVLTDIPPTQDVASVHVFIDPAQRRHSLRASRAFVGFCTAQGFQRLVVVTRSRAAHALAKHVGFRPPVANILTLTLPN